MYDLGQKVCIKLIEDGYINTFEEIYKLLHMNKKVREEAELGIDKIMPKDVCKEPEILQLIEKNLVTAEEDLRKGSFEENFRLRMKLGEYFHGLEGYHWLAIYFCESSQHHHSKESVNITLMVTSLQQKALLEETRGNINKALKCLEKAKRLTNTNSFEASDPVHEMLNENLCRMYRNLGTKYFEKEHENIAEEKSISIKYFKKAAEIAMQGGDLETKATCQALLGKAMMKSNNDELALKCFDLSIEFSKNCNDNYGMCQGYFAKSEIFKKRGDLENSTLELNKCQDLAREQDYDIPFIFASISLGQIYTAKRQYSTAYGHFEEAFHASTTTSNEYAKLNELRKLTKVMYGVGKAQITLGNLICTLQSPRELSLPKLLNWRKKGGPFTEKKAKSEEHLVIGEKVEKESKSVELLQVIQKLIEHELNSD